MAQNPTEIETFKQLLNNNPELLEKFKASDNAEQLTQPSILLKAGLQQIGITRVPPKVIEQYLLIHPLIPRGIEIKANRMTSRGYKIKPYDDSPAAKNAAKEMEILLNESGGEILINGWIKDTYAFGNGYLTLLPDKDTGDIVLLSKEHPMFFRISRNLIANDKIKYINPVELKQSDWSAEYGTMKIDPVTKKPLKYTQVIFDKDQEHVVAYGSEIPNTSVAHLVFDTWGDEAEGIGLIQYVYLILKYLMNIEEAGAEATYRAGFTQKKVTTEIVNEKDLKRLAKNLAEITSADSIILPKGTDVTNLTPGASDFTDIHDVFLNMIAMRIGVPKPILTLDGTDINKATMQELMRDLIYDIHADELKVKATIERQIFEPACKSRFGDTFEKFPIFSFNDFAEGKEDKAAVLKTTAEYVASLVDSYIKLKGVGLEEQAKKVLELALTNLPVKDQIAEPEITEKDLKFEAEEPETEIPVNPDQQLQEQFPVKKSPEEQ